MIELGPEICQDLAQAETREWLETNGIGGYASSTIIGMKTRRYHGLLVAATNPPTGRMVLLSKLEETLVIGDQRYELGCNRYPGVVHPKGYQYLQRFRLEPFPVWTYAAGDAVIEKTICMIHGENTVVVRYELNGAAAAGEISLEVAPLIAFRDYHSLTHENAAINAWTLHTPYSHYITAYDGVPGMYLQTGDGEWLSTNEWYRRFQYSAEQERGLGFEEDLFNPCVIRFSLTPAQTVYIIAGLEHHAYEEAAPLMEREADRRATIVPAAAQGDPFVAKLYRAADQFIVSRGEQKTVIAGYHWFTDWGRDTMIALPGLTLSTGRFEFARSILLEFAKYVDQGMLPNRFPDKGEEPEYNTVDATLWYFEAIRAYVETSGNKDLVRDGLYEVLADIIEWHLRGTRYNIKVDSDGLLSSGANGVQLTWMDAKVGDWVVTPRRGKPVEIQALWYNALCTMRDFAMNLGKEDLSKQYSLLAAKAKSSFNQQFWNEQSGCLYDVVDGDFRDGSIRPNQVIALSLAHSMVPREKALKILEVVERELLTPFGLRSLAPSDPRYVSHYGGDPLSRDGAYHQGTVWGWLIGPYVAALLKSNKSSPAARAKATAALEPFKAHLLEAGLGQVSEIFDGDLPHKPGGCIAQAWSVAELLRCISLLQAAPSAPSR